MSTQMNEAIFERLTEIISHGVAQPVPGRLCVEAAICLAIGEPHSDQPSSVALNDACWSSPMARAEALLPLAIAQLGTEGTDRTVWARLVLDGVSRRVLPMAFRALASAMAPISAGHAERLRAVAEALATGSGGAVEAAGAAAVAATRGAGNMADAARAHAVLHAAHAAAASVAHVASGADAVASAAAVIGHIEAFAAAGVLVGARLAQYDEATSGPFAGPPDDRDWEAWLRETSTMLPALGPFGCDVALAVTYLYECASDLLMYLVTAEINLAVSMAVPGMRDGIIEYSGAAAEDGGHYPGVDGNAEPLQALLDVTRRWKTGVKED